MTNSPVPQWSRRTWLTHNAVVLGVATRPRASRGARRAVPCTPHPILPATETAAALADPTPLEALAQRAVEAAHTAGVTYADARLTRTVQHHYNFSDRPTTLARDIELVGFGVRVLVNGYWGFSASPVWTPDEAARLAQEAVAQAKVNARGKPHTVELGDVPAVVGRWATPITIDPFTMTLQEKADLMADWMAIANRLRLSIDTLRSYLHLARQEEVLATSGGTLVTQTRHESGGFILVGPINGIGAAFPIAGIQVAGKGWEVFVEARISEQLAQMPARIEESLKLHGKPAPVGRYTVVCDGVTMARVMEQTFGLATQLDRALGYEANAGGTSYLNDPLAMLGTLQVAAPMVTITANRSAPAQLATVKWDAEGVTPQDVTLVKNGVLVDYQTTREQAAWLAPYYQKVGKPVRSHGYAGAEDALNITMQRMPNLALAPGDAAVSLTDLIGDVKDGVLVTDLREPFDIRTDQQARNGFFGGTMRQIKNGRLGAFLGHGSILFNAQELWKHIITLGGPATEAVYSATGYLDMLTLYTKLLKGNDCKGQPPQLTSYSVRAPAALISDQALTNQLRRA